jgi:hypothetical protein
MTAIRKNTIRLLLAATALAAPLATSDSAAALNCKDTYFITKGSGPDVSSARSAAQSAWTIFVTNTAGLAWSAWDNAVDTSSICLSEAGGTTCNAKARPCLNDTVVISGDSPRPRGGFFKLQP